MKYILDTHTLLWLLFDPENLSKKAREIICNKKAKCFVSIVTFWEIATKLKIGKLQLNGQTLQDVKNECIRLHFAILPVSFEHILAYLSLPLFKNHRDPFDRMLIATAVERGYTLISRDTKLPQYDRVGLAHLW